MRFRKLRIAWSVAWGVVAVLLCVLWVRSYSAGFETTQNFNSNPRYGLVGLILQSSRGEFALHLLTGNRYWLGIPQFRLPGIQWTHSQPYVVFVSLSYWLTTLASATLATIPWFPWSKSFSLRTLLIGTTLVALLLGLFVWMR